MLLRVHEVARYILRANRLSKRHLVLDLMSLGFGPGQGRNTALSHVADELARQFIKSFLSQQGRVVLEIIVRHKLHDISSCVSSVGLTVKSFLITIKLVHHREVSVTHTHNNYGKRVVGASHDLVNGLSQIVDYTIGNDQQHLELLIVVVSRVCLTDVINGLQDRAEMGRTVQVNIRQAVLVVSHRFFEASNSRIETVTVHREAVSRSLAVWRHTSTEAKQIDVLVSVVVLQNAAHRLHHLQVLVLRHVEVVKRIGGVRRTITQSEINCDRQINVATSEDVLQEGVLLFEMKFFEPALVLLVLGVDLHLNVGARLARLQDSEGGRQGAEILMFT